MIAHAAQENDCGGVLRDRLECPCCSQQARAVKTQGADIGIITAIGLFLLTSVVQLALETSSEITAETFADNDVGIVKTPIRISADDIVNTSPTAMIIISR